MEEVHDLDFDEVLLRVDSEEVEELQLRLLFLPLSDALAEEVEAATLLVRDGAYKRKSLSKRSK